MISQFLLSFFLAYVPDSNCVWPNLPILIGHRGAKARAPENTIESFEVAIDLGVNGVEFDVYLSADKIPFVFHDDTLERTTNGVGIAYKKSMSHLQTLDAAKGWPAFAGAKIPTLDETLKKMPDGFYVNVELKGEGIYSKEDFVDVVLGVIKGHNERLFIVVSSFDARLLQIARAKDASLKIGFLLANRIDQEGVSLTKLSSIKPNALHLPPALVNRSIAELAHKKGIRVMIWTVNDNAQVEELLGLPVDGIFSDLPEGFLWKESRL